MLKTAVWWTTWACNYKCAYCWQVQGTKVGQYLPGKMIAGEKWLEVWRRLKPQALDITGGEPFLVPGFVDLVAELASETRFGLTTNLSHDILDFVARVPPAAFIQLTCSLHPAQPQYNESAFFGRATLLHRRGYPVVINYVGWPEQLWMADHYRRVCIERGFRFHFDPYYPAFTQVQFSAHEQAEINRLRDSDRAPHPFAANGSDYNVNCSGGMDHLSVHPDGTAYRCLLDQQRGLVSLGNVFDPAFRLNDAATLCEAHSRCPWCDRDKVTVELAV